MLIGFEHVAAAPKKQRDDEEQDSPTHESMRGTRTLTAKPSTDEKRIKRRIRRNASDEGIEIHEDLIGDDLWSTASMVDVPPVPVALQPREAATVWGDWADAKKPATNAPVTGRYEAIGAGAGVRGVGGSYSDDLNEAKHKVEQSGGGLVHDHQLGKSMRFEFQREAHPWDKAMGLTSSVEAGGSNQWGDWAPAKPPATNHPQTGRYEFMGTGAGVRGAGGSYTDDLNEAKHNVERTGGGLVHDHQLGQTMRYQFRTGSVDYALEARELDRTEPRTVMSSGNDNHHLAWSDLRYIQNFLGMLSGHPANVTYTGDLGVEVVSGQMTYDGTHVTVTTANGHVVTFPAYEVLRVDPAEGAGAAYDQPQAPLGEGEDSNFNAMTPLLMGEPFGTMATQHEGHWPFTHVAPAVDGSAPHPDAVPPANHPLLDHLRPRAAPFDYGPPPSSSESLPGLGTDGSTHESWNPFKKDDEPQEESSADRFKGFLEDDAWRGVTDNLHNHLGPGHYIDREEFKGYYDKPETERPGYPWMPDPDSQYDKKGSLHEADEQGNLFDKPSPFKPGDVVKFKTPWNDDERGYGPEDDPLVVTEIRRDNMGSPGLMLDWQNRSGWRPSHVPPGVLTLVRDGSVHEADSWTKVEHPVRVPSDPLDPVRFQTDDPSWPAELADIHAANAAHLARLRGMK